MKKPDRWERMVLDCPVTAGGHSIYIYDTVRLLRQQHRWMVRLVEAIPKAKGYADDLIHRQTILTQLERRAK